MNQDVFCIERLTKSDDVGNDIVHMQKNSGLNDEGTWKVRHYCEDFQQSNTMQDVILSNFQYICTNVEVLPCPTKSNILKPTEHTVYRVI